jgi:hypothetical protein
MSRLSASVLLVCLIAGVGLGLYYGYVVSPVQYTNTDFASLRQADKDDYILMTATVYATDNNLDAAREQLVNLGYKDAGQAVADATERYIKAGLPVADLRRLVYLAIGFKTVTPAMQPYLP